MNDQYFQDFRDGRLAFDELARKTRRDWEKMAAWLLRRWRAPAGVVGEEDMVQELLTGAWIGLQEFDPTRGVRLRSFVVFTAVDRAKKWLHTQRKALRRDDKAPSRLMVPVSALGRDGDEEIDIANLLEFEADQERRVDVRKAFLGVPSALVAPLMAYVREGTLSEASWALVLDSRDWCRAEGVVDHDDARERVEDAVGCLIDGRAWEILESQERREALGVSTLGEARRAVLEAVA